MSRPARLLLLGLVLATRLPAQTAVPGRLIVVASKPFAESYLLGEMFAQLLEAHGFRVERRLGLGATEIAFRALSTGAIDVYPEYTGTGLLAILHAPPSADPREVFRHVAREFTRRYDVSWLPPLGFENTYAIAVRRVTADRHQLKTLSDLARVAPQLRAGFTADFLGRSDGLPGLARTYGLRLGSVRPLAPALKYQALEAGDVDVIDGYSTDGRLANSSLTVLRDDKRFFPPYEAAALVWGRLNREMPEAVLALTELSGRLDEPTMRTLNRRVELGHEPVSVVATQALRQLGLGPAPTRSAQIPDTLTQASLGGDVLQRRQSLLDLTLRHIELVAVSLLLGILVAVPLGLVLARTRAAAEIVVRGIGVLQTIPSLALLAFMIPLLGIGVVPALAALFLYSLFPILRNTYVGVREADPAAATAGEALGMSPGQVLRYVRLPLAVPTVMAGVRTAAVIGVGTATLAAFIGAGGLGDPIVTGLALSDSRMILSGAIPAAILALVMDAVLGIAERLATPSGVRN